MQETEKIWMNGELVDWADAKVHVLSHGLHYGSGVFEGIRAYETDRGTGRLPARASTCGGSQRSAEVYYMELPYSLDELRQATHDTLAANEHRLLLRAPDRVPRLRRARHQPAELPGRRRDRGLAVGRLPRRGGARDRRARHHLVVAPDRPEHGAGRGQGVAAST